MRPGSFYKGDAQGMQLAASRCAFPSHQSPGGNPSLRSGCFASFDGKQFFIKNIRSGNESLAKARDSLLLRNISEISRKEIPLKTWGWVTMALMVIVIMGLAITVAELVIISQSPTNRENAELQTALTECQVKYDSLKMGYNVQREAASSWIQDYTRDTNASLDRVKQDLAQAQKQVIDLQKESADLRAKNLDLTRANTTANAEVDRLKVAVQTAERYEGYAKNEAASYKAQFTDLEKQFSSLRSENARLRIYIAARTP